MVAGLSAGTQGSDVPQAERKGRPALFWSAFFFAN
jgi:hypothetical protein